jgi:hypothetical protein
LAKKVFSIRMVSGVADAVFRIRTDPFIVASKFKRKYDLVRYSLDIVAGKSGGVTKFGQYFDRPDTIALWDKAGVSLKKLIDSKGVNPKAAVEARKELSILMPEFGRSVIDEFIKGPSPITNATTAKAWFENTGDVIKVITDASVSRRRVILPRMTPARQLKVKALTATNKVFDFSKVSSSLVDAVFGAPDNANGLYNELIMSEPGKFRKVLEGARLKGTARFSSLQIATTLDNIKLQIATTLDNTKRAFTPIPIFKNRNI